jgi:hypothetical protein
MHRHGVILDGLGGKASLAKRFGVKESRVKGWYRRGIPAHYWNRIAKLAGPTITAEYLERTKAPGGRQRRVRLPPSTQAAAE